MSETDPDRAGPATAPAAEPAPPPATAVDPAQAPAGDQDGQAAATGEKKPSAPPLSLDEMCRRLSHERHHVELIAAFHFEEERDGRMQDVETDYRSRFASFGDRTVI